MMESIHSTREQWLNAAVEEVRPFFAAYGHTLPQAIRVTCGFPSSAKRSGAIGECWSDKASKDGAVEIMISPVLDAPSRVFDVLVHELCHSAPSCMNHGATFAKIATAMLLIPAASSWKATVASPAFDARYAKIIASLGLYPHAQLSMGGRKVQKTRMLLLQCPSCGYKLRTTANWLAQGLPTCHDGAIFTQVTA